LAGPDDQYIFSVSPHGAHAISFVNSLATSSC
jgi:hypothetical protein